MSVNKIKRYLLFLLGIFGGVGLSFSMSPCLKVTDINDNISHFLVGEDLRIDMVGEGILIGSDSYDIEIKLSDLKSFGYELYTLSEITEVAVDTPVIKVGVKEIELSSSMDKSYSAKIYDLSGTPISGFVFSGEATINIESFSAGTYIIKVDNSPAVKFIVK